jgi:O-antigen/teichoic acid export membrane protein
MQTNSLKFHFIRGTIGSFSLKLISTGLTFLSTILLARLLGTSNFGVYAYAMNWVSLLSIPASLGLNWLLVREVATHQAKSAWELMQGILMWSSQLVLIASISVALVAAGIGWYLNNNGIETVSLPFFVSLVALPILALRSQRIAVMQGLHKVVLGQLPEFLIEPILFLGLIGILSWKLRASLDASWVMGAYILTISVTFIVGALLLSKSLPSEIRHVKPRYNIKQWIHSALPFMLMGGLQTINSRADITMLGAIKGPDAVAVFVAIDKGVTIIVFILGAVGTVLAPTIASVYAMGNMERLQKIVTKSARLILWISLPITFLFIFFGKRFLLFFGLDYIQGYNGLIILCIAQLFNAAAGSVGVLLSMTGHEKYIAINTGINAILNITLNAIFIPLWGINGAAIASATTLISSNLFCTFWCVKKLDIYPTAFGRMTRI